MRSTRPRELIARFIAVGSRQTTSTAQETPLSTDTTLSSDTGTSTSTVSPTSSPSSSSSVSSPSPTASPSPPSAPESAPPPPPEVETLPLTEVPPVPELLSFNEWKERYVVLPDPSTARRAKKAAQRTRQDVVGAPAAGAGAALYDGDGADLGSLFAGGEEAVAGEGGGASADKPVEGDVGRNRPQRLPPTASVEAPPSDSFSPIQPLPNVGTGEPSDPLLRLKDRSNYAAFECAAMVHRSSRQSKGASSILVEKKDRYMLTPCSAKPMFVDVELCDEIQIDTLVLANFEFFSSTFKHFKASCSVDYPGKAEDWHDLGTFRARNVRGFQVFRPDRIAKFCRYLRIDFLSHFGSEYYCPVSLLRVYGYTQLDAWRIEEALADAELNEEEPDELGLQERQLEDALRVEVENLQRLEPAKDATNSTAAAAEPTSAAASETSSLDSPASSAPSAPTASSSSSTTSTVTAPSTSPPSASTTVLDPAAASSFDAPASPPSYSLPTSAPAESPTASSAREEPASPPSAPAPPAQTSSRTAVSVLPASDASAPSSSTSITNADATSSTSTIAASASHTSSSSPHAPSSASATVSSSSSRSIAAEPPIVTPRGPLRNDTAPPVPPVHSAPPNAVHPPPPPHPPRAPVLPPPIRHDPQPGESIYGTIMKRLTSLEHNQTLAMGFIEAQSSMLREAFGRIEKRLGEIEGMRTRQEQSIGQALLDLEKQRNEIERERLDLATQVSLLADEVRLEKRLTFAQLVGLLLVVIFVGFTRGIPTSPFLHLAATGHAQGTKSSRAEGKRREERERGEREKKEEQREGIEGGGTDAPRRHRPSTSLSLSHRQSNPSKRHSSLSKSTPRRHYGIGTPSSSHSAHSPAFPPSSSSASKPLSAVRSPRAFREPVRHSSAPPEEPFPNATALEAREAARRRIFPSSARKSPALSTFPHRPAVEKLVGLAIDAPLGAEAGGPSTPGGDFLAVPAPSFSRRNGSSVGGGFIPSRGGDDADIEPSFSVSAADSVSLSGLSGAEDDERFSLSLRLAPRDGVGLASPATSSSAGGDEFDAGDEHEEHGYHTYSSSDDHDPERDADADHGRDLAPFASDRSLGRGGSTLRPPKPHVRVRPATSMGFAGFGARTGGSEASSSSPDGPNGLCAGGARESGRALPLPLPFPASKEGTPEPPPEPESVEGNGKKAE
ncbi:hypothetical protein JCM8097_008927 [Rhodosporidiobolus ruineniae]